MVSLFIRSLIDSGHGFDPPGWMMALIPAWRFLPRCPQMGRRHQEAVTSAVKTVFGLVDGNTNGGHTVGSTCQHRVMWSLVTIISASDLTY